MRTIVTPEFHGYIKTEIEDDHYILGADKLPMDIVHRDGQWDEDLPVKELQRKRFETFGCTNFGTANNYEIIDKGKYGVSNNYSDRANFIGTRTNGGNDPHKVAELTRKYLGYIPEATLAFNDSLMSIKEYREGLSFDHRKLGARFLIEWELGHEWVTTDFSHENTERMKDALKTSPLGTAVQAWSKQGDYYVRTGRDTHWGVVYGYKDKEYWKFYDTYDNVRKKLAWDYGFERVKRYTKVPRKPFDRNALFYLRLIHGLFNLY